MDNVKTLFTSLYREQFTIPLTSKIECPFDEYFNRQIRELETTDAGPSAQSVDSEENVSSSAPSISEETGSLAPPPPMPTLHRSTLRQSKQGKSTLTDESAISRQTNGDIASTEATPIASPDSSRPTTPSAGVLTGKLGPGGKASRRSRKAAGSPGGPSREQSASKIVGTKGAAKKGRKWDDSGYMDDDEDTVLDYSAVSGAGDEDNTIEAAETPGIEQESWSRRTAGGEVVLKDLEDEMHSILSAAQSSDATKSAISSGGIVSSGLGAVSGLFRNLVGGKQLTEDDLVKPLKSMNDHLIKRNVAREAAERLCDSVKRDLLGTKTASFQSIDAVIRISLEKALTHILTPTSSLDLLRSIAATTSRNRASATSGAGVKRPYVISVVGVNGVGKSTTLAKLAFLLLENNYRVLVVGGDTFRSGAVEQLRVHVKNLQGLIASRQTTGKIDLYERGYGKDPAHIARDAVTLASSADGETGAATTFDVVLIDTAGRRHNDARLMSSLEGFARLANPDRIFMVGEALVGSDSVAQARDFYNAFGHNTDGSKRGLDGFIVSKCDTVGEMVGTIVSMVHATGVPVVAVGVGQHYPDLRTLSVGWCTRLLMQ